MSETQEAYRCRGVKQIVYDEADQRVEKWKLCFDSVDDDSDADLFGVYRVEEDGTDIWVADFNTKSDAENYIQFLSKQSVLLEAAEEVLKLRCPKGVGYDHAFEAEYCRVCGGRNGLCPFMKLKSAVEKAKGDRK